MIKKLRRRFILVSMLSVFCVLVIIMGAINISNYVSAAAKADELADYIFENGGRFPSFTKDDKPQGMPEGAESFPGGTPPFALGSKHGFTPETPFETRFFTARLSAEDAVTEINLGSIFAVSNQEATAMAKDAASGSSLRGYKGGYRYLIGSLEDGSKMAVFVDNNRELSAFKSFLRASLLVSAAGILAVFFLVLALSKRVISPIAESYDKQKRFITDASHELKTPLTIIETSAEVIAMEQGESEWTLSIRSQVKRLTELTNSLVALTRMDELGSRLIMTDFSLSDAVMEAAEPFSSLAASRGLALELDIEKNLSYKGCESALRQLVSILLENAVKYSSPEGSITLSLRRQGGKMALTCKNPAAPMKKGSHDELFRRFYRGDASRSSAIGGFGIGLSLARATVEAHRGRISAFSEDGSSLTVTVLL